MTKNIKLSICTFLATLMVVCFAFVGIDLGKKAYAEEVANANTFEMVYGASIRLKETNGIRFTVKMGDDTYENVSDNQWGDKLGMMIFPTAYLENLEQPVDYKNVIPKYIDFKPGTYKNYKDVSNYNPATGENDSYYYASASIVNLKDENMNLDFVAVAYYQNEDNSYTYASLNLENNARSAVEVATKAYELDGASFTAEQRGVLADYILKCNHKDTNGDFVCDLCGYGTEAMSVTYGTSNYTLKDFIVNGGAMNVAEGVALAYDKTNGLTVNVEGNALTADVKAYNTTAQVNGTIAENQKVTAYYPATQTIGDTVVKYYKQATITTETVTAAAGYKKVTSADELTAGSNYILVAEYNGKYYASSVLNSNNIGTAEINAPENGMITDETVKPFVLEANGDNWSLKFDKYVSMSSTGLSTSETATTDGQKMTITINDNGTATVVSASTKSGRSLFFRDGNGMRNYSEQNINASGYAPVSLYKEVATEGGEQNVTNTTGDVVALENAVNQLDAFNYKFINADETKTLPTFEGVTVAYALADNEYVSLSEGNLTADVLPKDADATVMLTATLTQGEAGEAGYAVLVKNYEITVAQAQENVTYTGDGTKENPYTVEDALKLLERVGAGETYSEKVYVRGYITVVGTDKGTYVQNAKIADTTEADATELLVYNANWAENSDKELAVGDSVLFCAWLVNYVKSGEITPEIAKGSDYSVMEEITHGKPYYQAKLDAAENALKTAYEFNAVGDYVLDDALTPATVVYAVEASTYVTLTGNTLTVVTLPEAEAATVTVTATLSVVANGETLTAEVSVTITLQPEGTEPVAKGYVMVKSATELKTGDQIIIAALNSDIAMSTTQNSSNRGATAITKNGDSLSDISESVQVLTLEDAGDGNWYLYTGSNYLYASSKSSNQLKTAAKGTVGDNGKWKITIADDGTATIVAQGANARNTMQYNTSGSGLFACYASATQKAICVYKNY